MPPGNRPPGLRPPIIEATSTRQRLSLPSLGLRLSERRLLLVVLDVFMLVLALMASLALATEVPVTFLGLLGAWKWLVTLGVAWFLMASVFDVYNLARAASATHSVRNAMAAAALTTGAYLAIPWLTPALENRSQGFVFLAAAVLLVAAWRATYALVFTQPTFEQRALLFGNSSQGHKLALALRSDRARRDANPYRGTGHIILGYVTEHSPAEAGAVDGDLPVLGSSAELAALALALNVDEVILALEPDRSPSDDAQKAILACFEKGVPLTKVTTIYERLTGRVSIEYGAWDLETVTRFKESVTERFYLLAKRLIDLFAAAMGIVVVALLALPIALANALSSRGPLFYWQERVGEGGRPFMMVKFRTMVPQAEGNGAVWASQDDPRVTPIGRWLRKLHLDELPQVLNVLRGEMSLIGPRPERPVFVDMLAEETPAYRARHFLRPGITGWAQIHQDYGSSTDDARVKLEFDLYYIKHAGFWLDLLIMLRTVSSILGFKGR